jgi:hypothetical protein
MNLFLQDGLCRLRLRHGEHSMIELFSFLQPMA